MRYSGVVNRYSAILAAIISIGLAQDKLSAATCPCDIYAAASPATPCVAAYSTVRQLLSTYTGPLYQVRLTSNNATMDIPQTSRGVADAAVQDAFLGTGAGTISKLYDQSGKNNHLIKAPGGSANGTTDRESNAKGKSFYIGGHKAYALFMGTGEGYRNNAASSIPTGTNAQGIYAVEDGSRANVGCCCCFDFGNAETNNQADGTGSMNSLFFGTAYWGKGANNGPWFGNDMEAGIWMGGYRDGDPGDGRMNGLHVKNLNLPSSTWDFAFGLTKTNTTTAGQYAIRVASGTVSGSNPINLVTAYDGQTPSTWHLGGAIILGIGGDNSNSSTGTFYEGVITAGRPSNATDSLVLLNVRAAAYGSTVVKTLDGDKNMATAPLFNVRYNPSSANAVISYTMQDARRVSMNIFDQQGRRVAVIVNGIIPAGRHEAVWDAKQVPAGVYVCRTTIDGVEGWTGRIVIGK